MSADKFVCTKCHRVLGHSWIKHIGCLIHAHDWHGLHAFKQFEVQGRYGSYNETREKQACKRCGAIRYSTSYDYCQSGTR